MTTGGLSRARGAADNQSFIRDRMKSFILERGLKAGDPLPNEQELMAQLGVGRHPLREAMKALQAVGIIEIRHGHGTYVGAVTLGALEDGLAFRMSQSMAGDLRDVQNVLEVRQAIEVGLAEDVVAHFGTHGSESLDEIVERMEAKAAAGEYFPDEDWAFHRALYEPLGNALVIDLLSVFWRTFADVDSRLPGARYTPADAVGWHRDLLDTLRTGDPEAFARSMKSHFHGIHTRLED
ncbi:DNA-binding FadR family transcriptional regulator [Kribbella amoyensis]|uniref:DNA-binding FadR family transcriptional regulator n=1 Tax=Kribbella amoyensis TaxID=996641 RepID=A0A561BKA9_9ACTN|nr:FCD domain-containing protein [Kribbella amoyensis]TWD79285.1 DNA-binding FadR family transcriptional regulator [Kribbella amoyensis]